MTHESFPVGRIDQLNSGLWMEACDNAILKDILNTLYSNPEALLPAAMPKLNQTAFLLWKSGRTEYAKKLLFICLAWYQSESGDQAEIDNITGNLKHMFEKDGQSFSAEEIHDICRQQRTAKGQPVLEIDDGAMSMQRTRFKKDIRPRPALYTELPLNTFEGWLKRLDPERLNEAGKQVLAQVFPMFGEPTAQQYLARSVRLLECGIDMSDEEMADISSIQHAMEKGTAVRLRRHRRYAGGDGLLPRGCYASVCRDEAGDDEGTLNRELMAYVDMRVPGLVYVGDSTQARLNAALLGGIGFRTGFCGTLILLLAPHEQKERRAFDAIYRDLLDEGEQSAIEVCLLETRVDRCTIDNVIDLRVPDTQAWFFEQFKNGDGQFLFINAGSARNFHDLIPTLMNPSVGGSDVTHAIGSFMRAHEVNALVFPSARSNASTKVTDGEPVDWLGWNLLDYRSARDVPVTEVTDIEGSWHGFRQPGAGIRVSSDGSFRVSGIQDRYMRLRVDIEDALSQARPTTARQDVGPVATIEASTDVVEPSS
jgi:hypothetical protein